MSKYHANRLSDYQLYSIPACRTPPPGPLEEIRSEVWRRATEGPRATVLQRESASRMLNLAKWLDALWARTAGGTQAATLPPAFPPGTDTRL